MSSTTTSSPESSPPNISSATSRNAAGRSALVVSLLLFLNCFYFLCSTGRVRTIDEVSAAYQVESLARRGTTAIPQAVEAKMFFGTFDRFGHPESPYPPGQAIAMLPWYAAGQFAARHLPGVAQGARDIVSDFFLTGESALFAALAAALAFYIFLRLGIAPKTSLAAAGILALATPLAAYSAWLFSEPLAAALLLGAAAVLFVQPREAFIPVPRALIAGALLGAALWVRPTHVIAVPVFLAAVFARGRSRGCSAATAIAAAAGIAACMLLWRNAHLYGSPFEFGYPATAEGGRVVIAFGTPLTTGLLGFLFSPGKSIFLFSPPIVLALAGLPKLWRRDRGLAVLAAGTPIVYLLFFATYTLWEGGYSYGPRYLVPALALLGLGIGPALETASLGVRRLAAGVFVAGFLVQAIGVTTSFLQADVLGGYYDAHYIYRMSFSPIPMHVQLLLHYAATSTPAPIGQGFDKWWVFLSKAGVSTEAIWILAGLLLLGAAASAWWLRRALSKATPAA
jgi:hypothetical protein